MGFLFGKLKDAQRVGDTADVNFYTNLRQTIQGLDNLILQTTLTGSGFVGAFLALAGILFKSGVDFHGFAVGRHGAWVISGGACVLAFSLFRRLGMYIEFLGKAVDLAKRVEERLLDPEFRLTLEFEGVPFAGKRGWRIFRPFLIGMLVVCLVATLFFLMAAFFPTLDQTGSVPAPAAPCKG